MKRRELFYFASAGLAASALPGNVTMAAAAVTSTIRAVAFDAFPIFDPRPVQERAVRLLGERGAELGSLWRSRQFEYQWLRALSARYANFWDVTEAALVYAAETLHIDLTAGARAELMQTFLELDAWPDARAALTSLQQAGLRLALLSNATPQILRAAVANAKLAGAFEHILSTDAITTYKPAPRAYRMGIDAFGLQASEILFVASTGWDAAGAKWFGYPTFWVNRQQLAMDELGVTADGVGDGMADLVRFVSARIS
jgi:2-haloacid dehalogenase